MQKVQVIKLKNGLVVANFSSNHSKFNPNSNVAFTFDDGSELLNCNMERMKALSMEVVDEKVKDQKFTRVYKGFKLTNAIRIELTEITLSVGDLDLIIVPFPMLQALSNDKLVYPVAYDKCCTASVDRATGICSSAEFCFL